MHRVQGRRYFQMAAKMQRDLREHILLEESRIAAYLHRAAWHKTQGETAESPTQIASGSSLLTWTAEKSHSRTPRAINGEKMAVRGETVS